MSLDTKPVAPQLKAVAACIASGVLKALGGVARGRPHPILLADSKNKPGFRSSADAVSEE
jgi:hypothetical protein